MRKQEKIFVSIGLIGLVIVITLFITRVIIEQEDLAFLQIDFTNVLIEAKRCLIGGGVVQDPSQGENGMVFVCSRQDLSGMTYPVLKDLSRRHLNYKYFPSEKCLQRKCEAQNHRINIGRGWHLLMSCDVERGRCEIR